MKAEARRMKVVGRGVHGPQNTLAPFRARAKCPHMASAGADRHYPLAPSSLTAQPGHGTPVAPTTLPTAMHDPAPTLPPTTPHGHHPDISNNDLPGGVPPRRRSFCALGPANPSSPDGSACRCWDGWQGVSPGTQVGGVSGRGSHGEMALGHTLLVLAHPRPRWKRIQLQSERETRRARLDAKEAIISN